MNVMEQPVRPAALARTVSRNLRAGSHDYNKLAPAHPEHWTAAEVDEYEAALEAAGRRPAKGAFAFARARRLRVISGDESWLLARAISAPEPLREYPARVLAELACPRVPQAAILQDRLGALLQALRSDALQSGEQLSMRMLDKIAGRLQRLSKKAHGSMRWTQFMWGRGNTLALLHGLTMEIRPDKRVAVSLDGKELVEVPATAAALRLLHRMIFTWRCYVRTMVASNLRFVLPGANPSPGDAIRLGQPIGGGKAIVDMPGLDLLPELPVTLVGPEPLAWKHWDALWALAHRILGQYALYPKLDSWLRPPAWPVSADPFARLLPKPRTVEELVAGLDQQGRERVTALSERGDEVPLDSSEAAGYRVRAGVEARLVLVFKTLALAVDFERSNRSEYF